LQSDFVTIFDLTKETNFVAQKLKSLYTKNLLSGWVNTLQDELDQTLNSIKDIKLTEGNFSLKRQNRHHLFVRESRNVNAVCQEIVESLANFLLQRININD